MDGESNVVSSTCWSLRFDSAVLYKLLADGKVQTMWSWPEASHNDSREVDLKERQPWQGDNAGLQCSNPSWADAAARLSHICIHRHTL